MYRILAAFLVVTPFTVALADAPRPPALDARAWLLIDASSGQSIASPIPTSASSPRRSPSS